MIDEGLNLAITDILPIEFDTKGKYRVKLTLVVNVYFIYNISIKLVNGNS